MGASSAVATQARMPSLALGAGLAVESPFDCEPVIRTPSTIGNVESLLAVMHPVNLCDWFQGTMPASIKDEVVARLSVEFGSAVNCSQVPKDTASCYEEAMQFADGVKLYLGNRYKDIFGHRDTCCLVLSGSAEPTRHLRLIKALIQLGVRVTRLDLAFDDRRGVLTPSDVYRAIRSGQMVSRWKESSWDERVSNKSGVLLGQGLVIGSKSSASYLSIYDKGLETKSESEGDWIRWELRLADKEAVEFMTAYFADHPEATEGDLRKHVAEAKAMKHVLCYDESEDGIFEAELTSELVDRFKTLALAELKKRLSFRDRTTSTNTSRAMVLPWWEEFLEYFDPVVDAEEESPSMDDWDSPSPRDLKKGREHSTRRKVDEILTEVYEEHIEPHKPAFSEILSRIPAWDDDEAEQSNSELLALAGLQPLGTNNVIPMPTRSRQQVAPKNRGHGPRSAQVISFRPKKSVAVAIGPIQSKAWNKCRSEVRSGAPPE